MNADRLLTATLDLRRAQRRHAPAGEVIALYTAWERAADDVLDDEEAGLRLIALEQMLSCDGRRADAWREPK